MCVVRGAWDWDRGRIPNGSRRLPEEMEVGGMTQEMARSFHEAMKAESTKETRRSDMRNSMNTFRCGHMTRHPDMSSLKKTSLKKRASIHYNNIYAIKMVSFYTDSFSH